MRIVLLLLAAVAFRFPERDLITEGIAHDAKSDRFFVSSIRKRKVIEVAPNGTMRDFGKRFDYAPVGMAIDPARGLLWVASAAFDRMEGYDASMKGRAALVALSLKDGSVVRKIEAEGFLDSVGIAEDGTVLVSEGRGTVYKVAGEELQPLVTNRRIRSPQAITRSASKDAMYIADYAGAIHRVHVRSGEVTTLTAPPDFAMFGIDGLNFTGDALIAIQNGKDPHRVVRFDLSPDGNSITAATTLESGAHLDEPTNGTIAGDTYYFVAASQGHRFDGGKTPAAEELSEPVIRTLPIRKAVLSGVPGS